MRRGEGRLRWLQRNVKGLQEGNRRSEVNRQMLFTTGINDHPSKYKDHTEDHTITNYTVLVMISINLVITCKQCKRLKHEVGYTNIYLLPSWHQMSWCSKPSTTHTVYVWGPWSYVSLHICLILYATQSCEPLNTPWRKDQNTCKRIESIQILVWDCTLQELSKYDQSKSFTWIQVSSFSFQFLSHDLEMFIPLYSALCVIINR